MTMINLKIDHFLIKLNLFFLWFVFSLTSFLVIVYVLIKPLGLNLDTNAFIYNQKLKPHYRLYAQFTSIPDTKSLIQTKIKSKDARVLILERYLTKYNSPMQQEAPKLAHKFVEVADKYRLPWTLLPAIGQCESNLGKYVPNNCYNAWGYGIHSRGTLCFSSWEEGIERVARGLSQDYIQEGLIQPEKIMAKYTPLSDGSWARCVKQFSQELEEGVE